MTTDNTPEQPKPASGQGKPLDPHEWPSDELALAQLSGNFTWKKGVIRPNTGYTPNEIDKSAITYLFAEWDFAYEGQPAPAAPAEPDTPTWMDDNILICGKHSIAFTKEQDECFVCTNRKEKLRERIGKLRIVGAQMANTMFNLKQMDLSYFTPGNWDELKTKFDEMQKAWDAVLAEAREALS